MAAPGVGAERAGRSTDGHGHLLVPLDGSSLAEEALAAVEPLAKHGDFELLLLRVVSPAHPVLAEGRVIMRADEVTEMHRRDAAEYLDTRGAALRRRGIRVRTRVAVGQPADTILAHAREAGTAVIVMSTHGRGPLPRILFGSVTAAVVRASPVPVLTVHPSSVPRPAPTASRPA